MHVRDRDQRRDDERRVMAVHVVELHARRSCTRRAMLLEAREQVAAFKWGAWLSKHFTLSKTTAWRYMRLAERGAERKEASRFPEGTTLKAAIGERDEAGQRVGSFRPIREFTAGVDADRLSQEKQTRDAEVRLHRELAIELNAPVLVELDARPRASAGALSFQRPERPPDASG
jgi:hypothetical protein